MRTKSILAALLLMVAGLQTAWAQKVVLYKTNGQTIECEKSELDSIVFVERQHVYVTSIVLSETSVLLQPGGTKTLTATVLPENAENKEVKWKSSNAAVAVVANNGTIVAMAEGTATITCSATDGSGVKAECQVTVSSTILVSKIELSETSLNLQVGGTKTLTATVLPDNAENKEVTWTSSNAAVAVVTNGGMVVALADGTSTITCSATDGSGVKAECQVTVGGSVPDTHDYVDLGLPSGTLWATCNVGANSPEEYGDYFAWGETTTKDEYSWGTYKYCKGSWDTFTKYCYTNDNGYNGFTDDLTELLPEDDAATANWGENWQMPSDEQIEELIDKDNTTAEWTTQNGVTGYKIVSNSNGKYIFLPAAGYHRESNFSYAGSYGMYWSCSIADNDRQAHIVLSYSWGLTGIDKISENRCYGLSIRPVRKQ